MVLLSSGVLVRIGTTADTHIEHRVASDSPELLGRDVDQHLAMVVAALRLCQLPAATLHIDGQFPAFCRVGGLFQLVTQLLVYIASRLRPQQIFHATIGCHLLFCLSIVGFLYLVIEQSITLSGGIFHVGLREIMIETCQHLVDALSQRIEGECMNDVEILSYLGDEKCRCVETIAGQFVTQIGEHGISIGRDTQTCEPLALKRAWNQHRQRHPYV